MYGFEIMLIIKLLFGLACGMLLFFIFAKINTALSSIPDYWEELEGDFSTERMVLNGQMINIIYQIGKPSDNGNFSPEQRELWQTYKELDKQYNEMFARHVDILVNRKV